MKKKYILAPMILTSSLLLAGCFGGGSDEAKEFAGLGEYEKSIAYLNAEIAAAPTDEKLQKQLADVNSEYAQALIDTVIGLREENTPISNREALKLVNKVIKLDPNADENLYKEKETLEKMYFEQQKLDEYAAWLNQNTVKMTEVLRLHRTNANALSEGVMNIQEFALQTTTLQNTMFVILTDAELQLTKTTDDMTAIHGEYRGKLSTYYETFRQMIAKINQGEILISEILAENGVINAIPNDYVMHVQTMHKMAEEKKLIFPENIDMEAYKEITGAADLTTEKE